MDINKVVYRPSCLIADAAGAITNGFMAAFNYGSIEDFSRVICWQHVKRNLEKRLPKVTPEFKQDVKDDVYTLQQCQSKELKLSQFVGL